MKCPHFKIKIKEYTHNKRRWGFRTIHPDRVMEGPTKSGTVELVEPWACAGDPQETRPVGLLSTGIDSLAGPGIWFATD